MAVTLSIDIETYSSIDIKAGTHPYTEAPDFQILLIAYSVDDGPVELIDLTSPDVDDLDGLEHFKTMLFTASIIKTAYNANFERVCLAAHFDQPMPPEEWRCTMIRATSLGLPASLADCGAALGIDRQKLTEGKELIAYFCKPCRPTKINGGRTRNLPEHAPDKWEDFRGYCVRDVEAENDIRRRLERYYIPDAEQAAWALDQRINAFGVRLDQQLMNQAMQLDAAYTDRLLAEARELTGLDNPKSTAQLMRWLRARGVEVDSLRKEHIPELIAQTDDPDVLRALELRQELSKTSTKKYEAMQRALCADGRIRNLVQFYGASRTGRWAGRTVQVQNLPRNAIEGLAVAREIVKDGDLDLLDMAFGAPPFVLSQLIRTAFVPSEGCRFIVADYSAIEARVIAWLADEAWVLEEFRGAGKIYEATAAQMFGVPKARIKKGNPEYELRPKGKVATLACGYQGGPAALIRMGALEAGIPEAELPAIVKRWRNANKRIVGYWSTVENAAVEAVSGAPQTIRHGIKFFVEGDFLFIRLPSGRRLAYYKPELQPDPKFQKMGVTYMGVDQDTKKYSRQRTYGGRLVENIVQATARDCLRDAMTDLTAAGYRVAFHVHDEVILDTPEGFGSLADVLEIMGRSPSWGEGLPLRAAGFESDFYMKD